MKLLFSTLPLFWTTEPSLLKVKAPAGAQSPIRTKTIPKPNRVSFIKQEH